MNFPFTSLYEADARDRAVFDGILDWYAPPSTFHHGERYEVARIPKVEGSDGNPSVIYETRMPARFYTVHVLDSTNSVGEPSPGFCLSTGSGDKMGQLCVQIALAAREGMIAKDDAP